jgi:hypothetical protein
MTGYLTQLLRSTFDPSAAATVQPRVSALFSPPEKVSAWRVDQPIAHESEAISEQNGDADAAVPGFSLRRPLTRNANPASVDEEDSAPAEHLPPTISVGTVVAADGEAERSESRARRSAPGKIGMREGPDSLQPEAPQIDEGSQGSRITAKPLRGNLAIPATTGTQGEREEKPSSFARAEQRSAKREIGTSVIGPQPRALPEESPNARARLAAASVQVPVQPGLDAIPSGMLQRDVRDANSPIPKEGAHKILPAFPSSPVENRIVTKHAEIRSSELDFGRNALSAGPIRFSEMERRESQTATPPEPTIEVTIGRIEVRGAAPAAPPQRASTQPSRGASLEEYLRRRSGRSRE